MSRRRKFEDSVVVSIDQVRDMIRGETRPPPKPAPVPIARPVPPEAVAGVPSFAEIAARRQQRWDSEPIGQAPVVRVAPRARWRGPLVAALAGALIAGGAIFAVHAAEAEPAPFAPAVAAYDEAVDNAVLQAQLRVARSEAEASRLKIAALEAQISTLQARPVAAPVTPVAGSGEAEAKPEKKARKRRRRSAKKRKASSSRVTKRAPKKKRKRRPAKKLTGKDKQLGALIDGL